MGSPMKAHIPPLALAVLAAASPAHSQQATERLERIEVTGSRIASSDIESTSPIAIVTAEEIRNDGLQAIEHVLNNLPQFYGEQNSRVTNEASGTATANLRGLGAARTLVLVNGRRLPMGNPREGLAADLNQIPAPLISRIEILTGGASAVYGSDAIAGVVNFILNDRFEGAQADITHEFHNHRQGSPFAERIRARGIELPGNARHDGATTSASLALGRGFAHGRGHASAFFRYLEAEALLQSERDYSACAFGVDAAGVLSCVGSTTTYPGRFQDLGSGRVWTIADAGGSVRPFVRATDVFNFAPYNYYQRPQERYSFHVSAGYDVSADARLYGEFAFHDDRTKAQIAPSGSFNHIVSVRYENPLLSDEWRSRLVFRRPDGSIGSGPGARATVVIGRRSVESEPRIEDLRHTSFRQVLGLRGGVGRWDYDVFGQVARVSFAERYAHDFSIVRTHRALDVVADPATGNAVCASVLDRSDPACVPWNIWRLGGVTPEALAYLETPATQRGSTSLRVAGGSLSGDLGAYGLRVPGTTRGIEAVIGVERRSEKLSFEPDAAHTSGDLAGHILATPPLRASSSLNEVFAEMRAPVHTSLNLGGSYRYSRYATGQATDTFGLGFNMATRLARLRGSYQHAIRAANLRELFDPRVEGDYFLRPGDPCSGPAPIRSLADCARTGVTASQYGRVPESPLAPVGFLALFGGDPRVAPEAAKTFTLGIVLAPLRDLTATLDYFDIRLADRIGAVAPSVIFAQCLDTGEARFCERIRRDSVFGSLWLPGALVDATNQNVGRTRVAGVDGAVDYRHRLAGGHSIRVDALGTYLGKWNFEAFAGAGESKCAGLFFGNCGAPNPRWRHKVRATWQTPWNLDLAATWRYIRGTTEDFPQDPLTIPSASYVDLAGMWRVNERLTMRAGMSNVADREPPIVSSAGLGIFNGNTILNIYDPLGRRVFLTLTAKF